MKIIKKEGYIIDPKKVNKILNKKAVKDYLHIMSLLGSVDKVVGHDLADDAVKYLVKLTPIEVALLDIERRDRTGMQHHTYITAMADDISEVDLFFESSCFDSVLGDPPYAHDYALAEEDIQKYQQEWRGIGIEPTLVCWEEEEKPSILSAKTQNLLEIAETILGDEGFEISYMYWSLIQNVPYEEFTEFAPGINVGVDKENGKFYLQSVVNCDVFCKELIYIDNEELLRSILASMILYIKDWHSNFQDLRSHTISTSSLQ